ncbi:MAG TPA: NAD(P)H-quinone oxidoreductase [Devosia sp.]|nr:NAD(P)H-quinone oxidoreductase [Devosia sp.]
MRAIEITRPGGPEVLAIASLPVPLPKTNEVLIKVAAAGINRPDILQRKGKYPAPPGASPLPGLEVAGTIADKGGAVKDWRPGDAVVALTNGGGYAEFVAVPAGQVLPLPAGYSMIEGAALPETLFTIQQTLLDRAQLQSGQNVLVHGGAGGIGAAALQLARLKGAIPFATVSTRAKADYAITMGARTGILYPEEDFVGAIKELTNGRGADIIVDIVGGDYLGRNLSALASDGTIIQLALLGGAKAQINLASLLVKSATLFGSTLRAQPEGVKATIASHLREQVWPAIASAKFIKPRIRTFALADASRAHAAMDEPEHFGKIVLCT